MKHYLTNVIKVSDDRADFLYLIFCISSPPSGILFGGIIVQKLGGYAHINSIYYILFNTFTCAILAIAIFFTKDFNLFGVYIWFTIFFGAGSIPAIGGSILSCLPSELKGSGFSLQNLIVNIVGYTPAPYIYGYIYQKYKENYPTFAMSFCLGSSIIGFFSMILVIYIRRNNWKPIEDEIPEDIKEKALKAQEIQELGTELNLIN